MNTSEFIGPRELRGKLNSNGVAIDGEVDARLTSYGTCLARLAHASLVARDQTRSYVAPDFDPGTQTEAQLRTVARADLNFLFDAISKQRAFKEAETPRYMR